MDTFRRDIQFALRTFSRRKAVALGAVASLAIAIAANTAVFSVANALLSSRGPRGRSRGSWNADPGALIVGAAMLGPIRKIVGGAVVDSLREE